MGMRLDLHVAGKSGGGCQSGMADKSDSPRLAGLRGLEESLRFHREAQVEPAAAKTPGQKTAPGAPPSKASVPSKKSHKKSHVNSSVQAVAPEPDDIDDLFMDETPPAAVHPVLRRRRLALPAFLAGRVARRVMVALAALFVVAVVGIGWLWHELSSGPIPLDFVTDRLAAAIKEKLG